MRQCIENTLSAKYVELIIHLYFKMMKKFLTVAVVAPIAALGIGTVAQAAVLTFDDIAPVPDLAEIPDGYGGFTWDNFSYRNGSDIAVLDTGYDNGRVSGDYVSYNGFGNQAIVSDSIFDFNSAYLTAAWNNGLSVTVEGLNNGTTLYSKTVIVDTINPTLVNFDYFGVDELRFTSSGGVEPDYLLDQGAGTQFALDNFTFNETVTSVPEPTLLSALLAVSTLSAGSVLKRKQQQKRLGKA